MQAAMATAVLSRAAARSLSAAAAPAAAVRPCCRGAAAQGRRRVQVVAQRPGSGGRSLVVAASGSQGSKPAGAAGRVPADLAALLGALKLASAVLFSPCCLAVAWAWSADAAALLALLVGVPLVWSATGPMWTLIVQQKLKLLRRTKTLKQIMAELHQQLQQMQHSYPGHSLREAAPLMDPALRELVGYSAQLELQQLRRTKPLATIMAEQRSELQKLKWEALLQAVFTVRASLVWFTIVHSTHVLGTAGVAQPVVAFAAQVISAAKWSVLGAQLGMTGLVIVTSLAASRARTLFREAAAARREAAAAAHSGGPQPGMPQTPPAAPGS